MKLEKEFRRSSLRHVVATALVVVAAAMRIWPLQALGVRLAYLTFYPAVTISSIYGGFWAGLLTAFLSALVVRFWQPAGQPFIRDSADWLGMAVFLTNGLLVSLMSEAMHRARRRAENAKKRAEAAERELEAANKLLEAQNQELQGAREGLARRVDELNATNQELEAFTYSVSHDLRAPLRHVDGFSKILAEEFAPQLPAEGQRMIERIRAGARQCGQLVDDLLGLSRVGRRELNLEIVGLKGVVEGVVKELDGEARGREIEWRVGELPFVECDAALIKQVVANLLSNALKYTRPRPKAVIEVGTREQEGQPVVYVRDNGIGFSMKYADKLFGVFQRLHRTEDFEGTGVGLATVQRIVHKHGGRVWAEAELDKGATFSFTLGQRT